MALMDWLRLLAGRAQRVELMPASAALPVLTELAALDDGEARAELDGLDFARAIRAHQLWKKRLVQVMNGAGDELFDIATVRRDDCCELGRWLHGDGSRQHGQVDTFRRLLLTHQAFHEAAADVLQTCACGDIAKAREMVERGLYARFSVRVQGLLAQFFLERSSVGVRH